MSEPCRILIIEDSDADFKLIELHLKTHGLAASCHRVASRAELNAALDTGSWEVVLSDYRVPQLDFEDCLQLLQARLPETPVIIVSGTIGEERAVELLKLGAWGFVLKDNLTRLASQIERSLQEAAEIRERKRAEAEVKRRGEELVRLNAELTRSNRATLNLMQDAIAARTLQEQANAALSQEITERKRAEAALRRLNRELRAISNCNQILMRAVDEQTLLNDICRIVCDEAGYRMAWVGYAENDEAKTVRPVAWGGFDDGYVANAKLSWADGAERAQGPGGAAIRSGETVYIQDFTTDPRMSPWRESVMQRGYRSAIALPLKDEHANAFGVLLIYSTEINSFTPDEIRLMEELAGDLAFGITVLRSRIERKRAEEKLRESEEKFRRIVETTNEGIWTLGTDLLTTFVNARMAGMTGYSAGELIGRPFTDVMFPEDVPDHHRRLEARIQGASENYERRIRRKDGQTVWALISANPVLDDEHRFQGTLAMFTDITERKQAEEALHESETRYRALFNSSADGIVIADVETKKFKYANPALCRMLGYTEAELCALGVADIHPPESLPHIVAEFEAQTLGDKTLAAGLPCLRKDGSVVYADISATKVIIDGRPCAVGFFRDITERKRAEEALETERKRMEVILSALKTGLSLINPDMTIAWVNQKTREMFPGREPVGLVCHVFYQSRPTICEGCGTVRAFVDGKVTESEQLVPATGRWYYIISQPIKDTTGRVVNVLEGITDITERKRAEANLAVERVLLRNLVDNLPLAVYLKDTAGRKTLANPMDLRNQGVTTEAEILGKTDFDIFPPEQAAAFHADDQMVLDGQPVFNREEKLTRPDGTSLWFLTSKVPLRDAAGKVTGLAGFGLDITERKQTEETIVRLAMAVEQSAETIVITNADGTIIYVNPTFEKSTGYTRAEALGQNPRILKSGRQDAGFYRQMWDLLARGEVWHGRFSNKRKDGTLYEEEATISSIRDTKGAVINYVAVKRDVTREVQLESQIRQSQKMEAIGTLAGGVAHDFNNILMIISMEAGLLKSSGSLSPEQAKFADEINAAIDRAAALTRQLLLFSRHEVLQARDLDLSESVTTTTKMLRRILGENIEVQLKLAPQPMFIHADAGMMDQVLMNLAVNARDAMPNGGRLVITTAGVEFDESAAAQSPSARPGSFVCLSVADTGGGIPPEILPRIFEPFFTTKGVGKGTGLGLATVFGIVQQHHGWINVHSEAGQGATFKVYLPRLVGMSDQVIAQKMLATVPTGKETILLVEDELALRTSVRMSLAKLGYRVLEASTGVKALEVWQEHRDEIRLLLTDLIMPDGMTGKELAQRLVKKNPKLKVIYMTGYSADLVGEDFPVQENVNFLAKPFQVLKLAQTIRDSLDKPA